MDVSSSDAVVALNAFEELAGLKVVLKENKEKILNATAKAEDVVVSLCVMEAIYKVVERRVEEAKTIEEVDIRERPVTIVTSSQLCDTVIVLPRAHCSDRLG